MLRDPSLGLLCVCRAAAAAIHLPGGLLIEIGYAANLAEFIPSWRLRQQKLPLVLGAGALQFVVRIGCVCVLLCIWCLLNRVAAIGVLPVLVHHSIVAPLVLVE